MSRALHASPSDLATGVAAVAVATIARAADVEALGAHAAANLPEAVLHESPCERAEKLSPRRGSCETNRASVCCRVPESPGSSPGLSLFRRAACRRSLGSARAPANFPAARARPRRYDVSGGNLRIGEAINSAPLMFAVLTAPSQPPVREIHDPMPVVLDLERGRAWLAKGGRSEV